MDGTEEGWCSQVGSTVMAATMAEAAAAEGCLLNMPRKIGFEILIFPRRVSTIPTFLFPTLSRSFLYSTVLRLAQWTPNHRFPNDSTFAREKYTFYPKAKYRCRYC